MESQIGIVSWCECNDDATRAQRDVEPQSKRCCGAPSVGLWNFQIAGSRAQLTVDHISANPESLLHPGPAHVVGFHLCIHSIMPSSSLRSFRPSSSQNRLAGGAHIRQGWAHDSRQQPVIQRLRRNAMLHTQCPMEPTSTPEVPSMDPIGR